MTKRSRLTNNSTHKRRRIQDISDKHETLATPSVSDSDSTGLQPATPTGRPTSRKNGLDNRTFIVGLDFGTTMTSISYYHFKSGKRPVKLTREKIKDITNWPSAGRDQQRGEVPSESLYLDGKYYWGYQARQELEQFNFSGMESDEASRLIRFTKLLFEKPELKEEDEKNSQLREVRETLRHLDKTVPDAVKDYLVQVFQFAKAYLKEQVKFTESTEVELCLSVPAGWPIEASWSLQHIVRETVAEVAFGQVSSLFIINEPEAASAFALDHMVGVTNVSKQETFMVCDAGGGTVDVTTYTVKQKSPFRLEEAVPPTGGDYGSTCVNQAMEDDLRDMLKGDPSFSKNRKSMEHQLSHNLFRKFENEVKRNFDSGEDIDGYAYLGLHGLEENPSKGFGKGMIQVKRKRVMEWFQPSLEGIAELIRQQLDACKAIDVRVQKIILFGGYSQSKTLQNFMKKRFLHPKIICPRSGAFETTVSRGTVHRAVDKRNGPSRHTIANIGILQTEPYNPKKYASHQELTPDRHSHSKKMYIFETVQWIIKKGQLADFSDLARELNHRTIPVGQPWVIKQSIYYNPVIDHPEDHYPWDHEKNAGSRWADTVVFDLTEAIEKYPVKAKGSGDQMHYIVFYDLIVELHGRNLKVSVAYPPGGEIQGTAEIAVAACFRPGTE